MIRRGCLLLVTGKILVVASGILGVMAAAEVVPCWLAVPAVLILALGLGMVVAVLDPPQE